MKSGVKKCLLVMIAAGLLAALIPANAFAATKAITSISIRVGMNVEAGDYLSDDPEIFNDDSGTHSDSTYVSANNEKYVIGDAEWVSLANKTLTVGDKPRMRVYIRSTGYTSGDSEYVFRGSYSSSNVHVSGGTFVSARRVNSYEVEIVVAMNPIKGQYAAPSSAEWRNSGYGKAVWNQDNYRYDDYTSAIFSGYYDVYLYRGSTVVKKLEDYHGTSYDFYPYMTKEGAYHYKVRSVPHTEDQKKYGKKSEWLDSDEIYIDKQHVSNGSGQVDENGVSSNNGQVGWIYSDNTWYYKYPDGSYQKDSWLQIGGIWYLFDSNGKMLTGWQTKNGITYYLQNNGAMYSGWLKAGELWYYLNGPMDGGTEGAMHVGWLTKDGKTYYLRSDGSMAEGWTQVDGNMYYFYPGYGYKATNTTIDTFPVDADGIWRK